MRVEYRKREYDGKFAIWRLAPSDEAVSPWVCIDVVDTTKQALAAIRQGREVATAA